MRDPRPQTFTQQVGAVRPRARRRGRSPVAAPPHRSGRLILVIGSDPCGLEFVLSTVRRRLRTDDATRHIQFPARISTKRRNPIPDHLSVTRRVFEDMRREGSFFLQWSDEFGWHGLPASVQSALEAGAVVVVGVPAAAEADARLAWSDVRVVRVTAHTDRARAPLTARACFERLVPVAHKAAVLVRPPAAAVHCAGAISPAIDHLTRAVLAQMPDLPLA